jgi:hypothetical protein
MPTTLEEAADAFYSAGNRLLADDPAATWKWPGHWRAVHHHTDRF